MKAMNVAADGEWMLCAEGYLWIFQEIGRTDINEKKQIDVALVMPDDKVNAFFCS